MIMTCSDRQTSCRVACCHHEWPRVASRYFCDVLKVEQERTPSHVSSTVASPQATAQLSNGSKKLKVRKKGTKIVSSVAEMLAGGHGGTTPLNLGVSGAVMRKLSAEELAESSELKPEKSEKSPENPENNFPVEPIISDSADSLSVSQSTASPGKSDSAVQPTASSVKRDSAVQSTTSPGKTDSAVQSTASSGKTDSAVQPTASSVKRDSAVQSTTSPGKTDSAVQSTASCGKTAKSEFGDSAEVADLSVSTKSAVPETPARRRLTEYGEVDTKGQFIESAPKKKLGTRRVANQKILEKQANHPISLTFTKLEKFLKTVNKADVSN
eukprot:702550_1